MLTAPTTTPELWIPIVKSEATDDGRLHVFGVASDCSVDAQHEIVKATSNPSCIDFINQGRAVFDFNHNSDRGGITIGKPTAARFITREEARAKYPGFNFVGRPVEVEGYVNRLGRVDLAPPDLKAVHHYADVEHPLGFSIRANQAGSSYEMQGGRRVPVAIPGPIFKIAICEQPVNGNSPCFIAKSLGAFEQLQDTNAELEVEAVSWDAQTPRLLVVGGEPELVKALSSDSVLAGKGTTGGEALKVQSLQGRVASTTPTGASQDASKDAGSLKCLKCHKPVGASGKYCGECGEMCKSLGDLMRESAERMESMRSVSV